MSDKKQTNSSICCDVCECVHNVDGCNCDMDTIKVTKGQTDHAHFCKTYECECEDCNC